jgi:microsomal dipeptidase-like Zn-dependent dipeptidase
MHCHSAFKGLSWQRLLGKSYYNCRNEKTSIWYNDPPKRWDRALNRAFTLTRFTQSDFRTLTKGDVKIISASLSPIERGLFMPRWPATVLGFILIKTILELKFRFIRQARKKNRNYFNELLEEYRYYKTEALNQQGHTFPTKFVLINHYDQIEQSKSKGIADTIFVFFSIEGCHAFNNGGMKNSISDKSSQKEKDEVLDKIQLVKDWIHRPLFISLAHHLNNDLCGHAKSLPSCLSWVVRQKKGMGKGITQFGFNVLDKLLEEPKRIYIDIKHMSVESRRQYYKFLEDKNNNENMDENNEQPRPIPILVSHGALNGRILIDERIPIIPPDLYYNVDVTTFKQDNINFFDDEIIKIADSGGFFGIQLDERRLCSRKHKRANKKIKERGKLLYFQAGLVWKQIKHIAVVLDKTKRKDVWDVAALGSDYDGLVDPPNGYWTSDDFGILEENLIHHAVEYFEKYAGDQLDQTDNLPKKSKSEEVQTLNNKDFAVEVVEKFMRGNAERFIKTFLR